jgi:hypothetical protein
LSENNYTDFKDDRSVVRWFSTQKTGWVTHQHVNQANTLDQKEGKKTGKWMKAGMLTDDAGGYKSDPEDDDSAPDTQADSALPDTLNLSNNPPGGSAANPPLPPAAPPSLPPSETKAQEKEAAEEKAATLKAAAAQKEMDALVQAEVNKRLAAAQAAGRFVCFEL